MREKGKEKENGIFFFTQIVSLPWLVEEWKEKMPRTISDETFRAGIFRIIDMENKVDEA